MFGLTPNRSTAPELMDSLEDPDLLRENLRDLARVNRWLGGTRLTCLALRQLLTDIPVGSGVSIIDVATGGADIPRAVAVWVAKQGFKPKIAATDRNEIILRLARESTAQEPRVTVLPADAIALPFPDNSFDIATCSLALHHFDGADATKLLSEMGRVSRQGVVINDLIRCWHGYLGARVLGRLATRNAVTRHDAVLSMRRAYTKSELLNLVRGAGLLPCQPSSLLGFRIALPARKLSHDPSS